MAKISPLRQRMIEDMTIRNLSRATQQSYIYAVRKFSRHFGSPPDSLGVEDVQTPHANSHWPYSQGAASLKGFIRDVNLDDWLLGVQSSEPPISQTPR